MDIGSTNINSRWRISILVSFLGVVLLVFLLKQCRDSVDLSSPRSLAVLVANPIDLFPSSTNQSSNSPSFEESRELEPRSSAVLAASSRDLFPSSTNQSSNSPSFEESRELEPQSSAVLIASSRDLFPSSTNQSSDSPHSKENKELKHEDQKGCDIFDGKWIYDLKASPLYNGAQCPFLSNQVSCQRNGRPDFDYERWSWEGNQCAIPRFNGTDMLESLRGKRVIIVGDSLNRNQWESLACLLYSSIAPSDAHVKVRDGMYKVFHAKNYNCSVEFFWSPFLVQLEVDRAKGTSILNLEKICASAKKWKGANIMIFNTGHWWKQQGKFNIWNFVQYKKELLQNMETELAFKIAMKTWTGWIDKNVDATETKVYFRSISPEHKGKQWCHNETQPIMDNSYQQTFPHTIREITERTIERTRIPVTYLNITKLSEYRRDAHPTVYTSRGGKLLTVEEKRHPEVHADCSHWCLPGLPDTWNRLLYSSLVLDGTRGSSSSSHLAV